MKCTTANYANPEHPKYKITFNYEFLDDMYSNWRDGSGGSDSGSTSGSWITHLPLELSRRQFQKLLAKLKDIWRNVVHFVHLDNISSICFFKKNQLNVQETKTNLKQTSLGVDGLRKRCWFHLNMPMKVKLLKTILVSPWTFIFTWYNPLGVTW